MGTFGPGSFDNDDATDWGAELADSRGLKMLKRALREVLDAGDSKLEADVAARGVAAAEVVAGLNDAPGDGLPEEVESWIEEQRDRSDADLSGLALEVIERVRTNCELADQWSSNGDGKSWTDALADLEKRLKAEEPA